MSGARDEPQQMAVRLAERLETASETPGASAPIHPPEEQDMNKDRMNGAADQAKGAIKEGAGKLTGDEKLKAEGAIDKAKGKVESAAGKVEDELDKD